ncbi:MAG: peptide chain release factor N(5)-glutamine methyltransferase [Planctomycetota bacterium]
MLKQQTIADIISKYHSKDKSLNIDIETLLSHSMSPKYSRLDLHREPERKLTQQQAGRFYDNLKLYRDDYPLAYILGHTEFMSLDFITRPGVLIPRPETEFLVEAALAALKTIAHPVVMDIGTGSGNIAVSIAKHTKAQNIRIFASDISLKALSIAHLNARKHKVSRFITFCKGDLFNAFRNYHLEGKVDIIVSNPPYVAYSESCILGPGVRKYEPKEALFAPGNGLSFYKTIISSAPRYLKLGGYVILEMSYNKSKLIKELVAKSGYFDNIRSIKDYNNIERVIIAKRM